MLLKDGEHSDVNFLIGDERIKAHKAILCARSEYFQKMFLVGRMRESSQSEIVIDSDAPSFQIMLEFIYSNSISDIDSCTPDEMLALLVAANRYGMEDLRAYCEPYAAKLLSMDNIAAMMLISLHQKDSPLSLACIRFIQENRTALSADATFYKEVENNPELGIFLFKYAVNLPEESTSNDEQTGMRKRRRYSELQERELDLVPPQLNNNAATTNTIAQSNASVQDVT
jgi:speckle-type POZ protein